MMNKDRFGMGARMRRLAAVLIALAFLSTAVAGSAFAEEAPAGGATGADGESVLLTAFGDDEVVAASDGAIPPGDIYKENGTFFASPAGAKASIHVGDGFVPIDSGGGEKLTVFRPWSEEGQDGVKTPTLTDAGDHLQYEYAGASGGDEVYLSAVLFTTPTRHGEPTSGDQTIVAYMKVAELKTESGTVDLSDMYDSMIDYVYERVDNKTLVYGDYGYYIFCEKINSGDSADFASEIIDSNTFWFDMTPATLGGDGEVLIKNATETSLTLEWTAGARDTWTNDDLFYEIYQKEGAPFTLNEYGYPEDGTLLAPSLESIRGITSYDVTGLNPDSTYYFMVVVEGWFWTVPEGLNKRLVEHSRFIEDITAIKPGCAAYDIVSYRETPDTSKDTSYYSNFIRADWQLEPYWDKIKVGKDEQAGIGGKNGPRAVTIGFGGEEWYLIGHDGKSGALFGNWFEEDQDAIGSAMLLSKNGYGKVPFNSHGNNYRGGDLQALLDDVYLQIPAKEQRLIVPYDGYQAKIVLPDDGKQTAPLSGTGPSHVSTETLNDVKLWPLSCRESYNAVAQVDASILSLGDDWWVQPMDYRYNVVGYDASDDDSAEVIKANGKDMNFGAHKVTESLPARPAVNLDVSKLFFTSPASGANTKESVKVGDGFVPIDNGNGPVKLTVFDLWSKDNPDGLKTASMKWHDPDMGNLYDYSGASTGSDTYISAVLVFQTPEEYKNSTPFNRHSTMIGYAKLAELTAEQGTIDIWKYIDSAANGDTAPEGKYTAFVFAEKLNGDNFTDFASEPWDMLITTVDRTPPVPGAQGEIRIKNAKETSLTLEWTAATDNMVESDYLYYSVYMKEGATFTIGSNGLPTDGTLLNQIPVDQNITYPTKNQAITSYDITGLDPDKTYYFLVVVSTEYNLLDTPGVFEWSDRFYKQGVASYKTLSYNYSAQPAPAVYGVNPDFGTWKGSGTVQARVDAPHKEFKRLLNGGVEVPKANYDTWDGSTYIRLHEDYLKTLKDGKFAFKAEFVNGVSDNIGLTVQRAAAKQGSSSTAKTGDDFNAMLWVLLGISALLTVAILLRRLHGKPEEETKL